MITAEKVNYLTPVRIGEFETTVARLLREVDPIAVYMDSPAAAPWAPPEKRLSSEERVQYPETTHISLGLMSAQDAEPIPSCDPQLIAAPQSRSWVSKRFVALLLIGIGAIGTVGLIIVATVNLA